MLLTCPFGLYHKPLLVSLPSWPLPTTLSWPCHLPLLYPAPQFFFFTRASFFTASCRSSVPSSHCDFCLFKPGNGIAPSSAQIHSDTPCSTILSCVVPSPTHKDFWRPARSPHKEEAEPVKGPVTVIHLKASNQVPCLSSLKFHKRSGSLWHSLESLAWLSNTPLSVALPNYISLTYECCSRHSARSR